MKPRWYVDIDVGRRASPIAAAMVIRVLHGAFRNHPGRYALALPDFPRSFPRLRVFADSRDDLDALVGAVDAKIAAHARFGYPKDVKTEFDGPWISYRRYRIPTRRAERKPDGNLRLRRMAEADTAGLPYFQLHSDSTGQAWRLYVTAMDMPPAEDCEPDSYGLSVASRPFALPALP